MTAQAKAIIDFYLAAGVIQQSRSLWAVPVITSPKTDGKTCITFDCKRLKNVSIVDILPISRLDEFLDFLGTGKISSTSDMLSGLF